MRVPCVEPQSPVTDEIKARRGGELLELDRALLHSPPIASGWNALLGAVRTQTSIRADLRELAICRIAALNEAWFEWKHHYPLALKAGLNEDLLQLVKLGREWKPSGTDEVPYTALNWIVLEYVDSMTLDVKVPDKLFQDLKAWWDDKELVELTVIIATYNMVSRFLVALDVGEMNRY
jgi:alkylhydroperoxidase family enzyme